MNRRRALRVAGLTAGVLVVVALVVVVVLVVTLVRRPLPDRDDSTSLPGLDAKVTVLRDDRGVPQVYADTPADLFRAEGFVHAQDQFFQMDLRRHITAGRLSELVGDDDDAIRSDAVVRTLGWRRVAQQELAKVSPSTRSYLEAYAEGVNAYIRGRSPSELSVSYTILARDHPLAQIEPWTPVDSLAWLKAMAWDLRSNYDEELARARALGQVRQINRVNQLFPEYPYDRHAPIIDGAGTGGSARPAPQADVTPVDPSVDPSVDPEPEVGAASTSGSSAGMSAYDQIGTALTSDSAQNALAATDRAVDSLPTLVGSGEGTGSNSWVVSGSLTATGLPLLANDPHLGVSQPGVWYQVGLHCNQVTAQCPFDVAGFGFAGLPGVVVGHNNRIAWGLTNLYPDVTDFYLERIDGDEVQYDGKERRLATRTETIAVAGGRSRTVTIRTTPHGPVLSDVLAEVGRAGATAPVPGEGDDRDTQYAVSLAWTALTPGRSMDAVLDLDRATDFTGFRKAVLELDAPAQNVIYADVDGNIGYQAPGRVPVRGPGDAGAPVPSDGTWPQPGWDERYDWRGTVPLSTLPYEENPRSGYIVAANQAVAAPGSGVPELTQDWDYGFRSQRIRDLIGGAVKGGRKLTTDDMRSIQQDTYNSIAKAVVPLLLNKNVTTSLDSFTMQAVDLLRHWDFTQPTDSAAAAYFNVVWSDVLNLAFADELPEGFRPDGGDRWFEVVTTLINSRRDPWWDDKQTRDVVESRDEVLRRALAQARLQLTSKLGKDPGRWEWGRLHRVTLEQTPLGLSGSPGIVRRLVNRGPFEAPGGSSIVDAFSWDASSGTFDVTSAPSMRMIVDLSDLDQSRWVDQTGISGHPWDSHYGDQTDTWIKGEDYAWPFSAAAVRQAKDDTETLDPTGG